MEEVVGSSTSSGSSSKYLQQHLSLAAAALFSSHPEFCRGL